MSTEKMREEFEAWAITSAWLGLVGDDLEFIDGGYVYPEVHSAWLSWQASRAAIEVKLPAYRKIRHMPMPDENESYNEAVENCRDTIESIGLRVKP